MQTPSYPNDELERISALCTLNILDSGPEERFDRLTRLAKRLFSVPISVVSLVDQNREWLKSSAGPVPAKELPREISFCGHTILQDDIFIVEDTLLDERFYDNPLVTSIPNMRFYAGFPLTTPYGDHLGALCIIDDKPRKFSEEDYQLLKDLGDMASEELRTFHLATTDELTLLSNRRGFHLLAQHALQYCKHQKKNATLFYFDLDDFKKTNDFYGHAIGDKTLINWGRILLKAFSDQAIIGRLGGDEFVALVCNTSSKVNKILLNNLKHIITTYNDHSQNCYNIHYSCGVSCFDSHDSRSIDDLLQIADHHMYMQKEYKNKQSFTDSNGYSA